MMDECLGKLRAHLASQLDSGISPLLFSLQHVTCRQYSNIEHVPISSDSVATMNTHSSEHDKGTMREAEQDRPDSALVNPMMRPQYSSSALTLAKYTARVP
ncbi:unnamed protein product [Cercospora beticola]|nr:unnamed protein product [Cercospora beticola]